MLQQGNGKNLSTKETIVVLQVCPKLLGSPVTCGSQRVHESDLNEKIKTLATREEIKKLATKTELEAEQDKIMKLQTYDLSLFIGQSYFVNDRAQLYLILQPLYYTLKWLGDTEKDVSWKYKGLSTEKLTDLTTTDNSLSPSITWYKNSNFYLMFKRSCLRQKKLNFYYSKYNTFFLFFIN